MIGRETRKQVKHFWFGYCTLKSLKNEEEAVSGWQHC
jgi:hypothetical protein